MICPVPALRLNPAGEEVYAPPEVPVNVTLCTPAEVHHGDPEYEILAVGNVVIVTAAVDVTAEHPPAAAIVYVTVYEPAVLVDGVICPVPPFKLNPAGVEV